MDVVSRSPLPIASLLWQAQPGAWMLTVVCKATFDLLPGQSALRDNQQPIHDDDVYWDNDPGRGLHAPSDMVPQKPCADVVLVGSAFAPSGQPARSVIARLLVGEVDKSIEVSHDRWLDQDGAIVEGPRFTRMSLGYERAAGGPDTSNPIGVRMDARDTYGRVKLPNLQPPSAGTGQFIPPIGFGPIPGTWPSRRSKLGRHASTWTPRALATAPLPEDIDPSFFSAAPPDQQLVELRDTERLILEHLHPHEARFVTNLPGLRPQALLKMRGEIPLRCSTLWIDTDQAICTVTWSGQVALLPNEAGRVGIAVKWLRAERPRRMTDAGDEGGPHKAVLPFTGRGEKPPDTPPMAAPMPPAPSPGWWPPPVPIPVSRAEDAPWGLTTGAVSPVSASSLAPLPTRSIGEKAVAAGIQHVALQDGSAGVLAASNAASASSSAGQAPSRTEERKASSAAVPTSQHLDPREMLHLLWYEPATVAKVCKVPVWRAILDKMEDDGLDDPAPTKDPVEIEDQRDIFEILARGASQDADQLGEELARAIRPGGKFVPPLLLLAGELTFPFDERETLQAAVAVAATLSGADEGIKTAVRDARELLAQTMCPAPLLESYTMHIREAVRRSVEALDTQVERALLEARHYQRRQVLGMVAIRALLHPSAGGRPAPLYLPEGIARKLPLFQRFRARLIAELSPQEDQFEQHPAALRGLALGRVMTAPERLAAS